MRLVSAARIKRISSHAERERSSPPAANRKRAVLGLPFASAIALAAYLTLGHAVSQRPPGALDLMAASESGHLVPLALFLRWVGLFPPYAMLSVVALVASLFWRAWLPAALVGIAQLVVVWRTSDFFKTYFHRARPDWWFQTREDSFSYASGHAAISLAFYGFVAYAVWVSDAQPSVKRVVASTCGALIVAIGWSRLALGAHYATDVMGGYLLGIATLCIAIPTYELVRTAVAHRAAQVVRQTSGSAVRPKSL